MKGHRLTVCAVLGSIFYSGCTVIGLIFSPYGRDGIGGFGSLRDMACDLGLFLLFAAVYFLILTRLLKRTYGRPQREAKGRALRFFDAHLFAVSFGVLLAAWMLYLIIFYPGSVTADGVVQLMQGMGLRELDNKHPMINLFLPALFFRIGRPVNDSFGIFLFSLFQTVMCALLYAVSIKKIRQLGAPVWGCCAVLGYFALFPVWGNFSQALVKDTPFAAVLLLFTVCFLTLMEQVTSRERKEAPARLWLAVLFSGFLVCLFRHDGKYGVFVPLLVLIFAAEKKWRKRAAALFAASVALFFVYNFAVTHAFQVRSSPTRALFSIPFQQTAKYLRVYPQDVTEEEYAAIDRILDADKIGKNYDPMLSDPVKNTYNYDADKADLARYFKAWAGMFFKHPGVYFEAFFQQCYGYLDPYHWTWRMGYPQHYTVNTFGKKKVFDYHYAFPESVQNILTGYEAIWEKIPLVSFLFHPGLYTWVMCFCALLLIAKGRIRQLVLITIPLMRILICMASPVNFSIRYALPVMALTPLILAFTIGKAREADTQK